MILDQYNKVRQRSVDICRPLQTEDYVVQPVVDVSPPKWHLGHSTWFFETFLLIPHSKGYKAFDPNYNYVFNSYYESVGARVIRTDRGNLSRPTVEDIFRYREHVDQAMQGFLGDGLLHDIEALVVLGCNHEEQHQELLLTDIKYILGHNPLFPSYGSEAFGAIAPDLPPSGEPGWAAVTEGIYSIGHKGQGFCFDNELGRHEVYLPAFEISRHAVTNGEYLEFMKSGGYKDFRHWHAEGWDWVRQHQAEAPLYWHNIEGEWMYYSWEGLQYPDWVAPVCHVSYYEAAAFASWAGRRLPTEAEWETASEHLSWGHRWEWTESAYLPYPGFVKAPGAIGEYNGKFMISQMVLRGASEATPPGHSRNTYRNFFHPSLRWQFNGIRLTK